LRWKTSRRIYTQRKKKPAQGNKQQNKQHSTRLKNLAPPPPQIPSNGTEKQDRKSNKKQQQFQKEHALGRPAKRISKHERWKNYKKNIKDQR